MFVCRRITKFFLKNNKFRLRPIVTSPYPDIQTKNETIAEHIFKYCDQYSSNLAYINDVTKTKYTYGDLKNSINNIASALTKRGVKQGTMVGIIATNCAEYVMLIFALSSMGCSVTVCNQNYTQKELIYQFKDSQPSILFTNKEYLQKVSEAASQLPNVKTIFLIGNRQMGFETVNDLINDRGNMSPIGSLKIDIDSHVALMPYSSGTTGLPKGVMLTHKNLVSNFHQIKAGHEVLGSKRMIMTLPLYHIYAIMLITTMAFTSGSTVIVQPKFEPINFLTAIDKYKVNLLHLVPPQILFLLNHPAVQQFNLTSVEKCFSAAAPLDSHVEDVFVGKFRAHHSSFDVYQGYGLSETAPLTHMMPNYKREQGKKGSIGLLLPSMRCKVVDPTTREEVSANKKGEILFQGPNIMKGYYGKNKETDQSFENEWFKTGDIGYYDEDNYFYISDRLKELIKVKGHQVAPAELEATLLCIAGVADCAVIGVPDERCGEVPRAFIVKNKDIQEYDIHEFVNSNLSSYKQLKGGVVFINEIPKSPSGKILRRLLKDK